MPTLVVVRPLTDALRCAACHDDLGERRVTCRGCRAVLHRDCRADLARCPTYGCAGSLEKGRAAKDAAALQQRERGALFHLVWLIPGLLSFLWPLWVALLDAETPAAIIAALVVGPVIGHAVVAPIARANDDPGSPHVRAMLAEMVGFGLSLPVIGLYFVVLIASLF